MSNARGILLEIAGHSVAYASHASASAVADWATTIRQAIIGIPQGSIISVDFDTYQANTGGTEVQITDASAELNAYSSSAQTTLTAALTSSATTITVASTSGFSSSGTVWIGQEAISYSGTTATTFTGCTRAQLGTTANAHVSGSGAYSYAPSLLGRKCVLRWYDLRNTASETTRYTGYIDAVDFDAQGYRFSIISAKGKFEDAVALQLDQGKGRLYGGVGRLNRLEVMVSDTLVDDFLELPASSSNWDKWHLRIDNELIEYEAKHVTYPGYSTTVVSVTDNTEFVAANALGFEVGRTIEFLSGGEVVASGLIEVGTSGATIIHGALYSPSVSDVVRVAGVALIVGASRGVAGTKPAEHENDSEVTEYRVISGNQVDILLWLMLSKNGDKTNTDYDILPVGWGAGIDSDLVDLETIERVALGRATSRRYKWQEKVDILEFMGMVATATNCRFYWGTDGRLTCNSIDDRYPLDAAAHTVDKSKVIRGTIPSLRLDKTRVRNVWEWSSDYDIDGDRRKMMRVAIEESRRLYGDRPMPPMNDLGMFAGHHNGHTFILAHAALAQRSAPVSVLTVEVLFDESKTYLPGDIVDVTLPHIPDVAGGKGLTATKFEVMSYTPDEQNGRASLVLVRRSTPSDLGHVAPAGYVSSKSGNDVTLAAQSTSHYAPASPNYVPPGNSNYDGAEDVHWFLASDAVMFVDVSTLGSATPTTATTTISSIDYATRVVTVAAAPAWLAAGDLMRLDDWAAVGATGNATNRQGIFIAFADDTTEQIDSDDAYRWGF